MKTDNLDIRNMDCMELMAEFPDNHFDLAVVDPPYGIGESGKTGYGEDIQTVCGE
jgi:site-specific DNA-methyltransferase (adenine-specific)